MTFHNQAGDTRFTVFIRLPFTRGDFVDPPPVEWNAAKDQALWDALSRPSKGDDIDWKALAASFDVTLQFLLQQAAWLYDRVRAQMLKVGTAHSTSPSPAPGSMAGSIALGSQPGRGGIPGTGLRAPPRLTLQQKDSLPQRMSGPRRTSSTTTINQLRSQEKQLQAETPTPETGDVKREANGRQPSVHKSRQALPPQLRRSPTLEEEGLSPSSSEDSDSDGNIMMSRTGPRYRRFGQFSTHRPGLRDDEEEDEDESPAFLPFTRDPEAISRDSSRLDLNATLRLEAEQGAAHRRRPIQQESLNPTSMTTESSISSVSSGASAPRRQVDDRWSSHPSSGTFSSRRATELARSSPQRSIGSGKDASETPSIGSSYGDFDDSVTQSALEEALLSGMQHGGMASRMSTISQALRSHIL